MKSRLILSFVIIFSFALQAQAYNAKAPECQVIKMACDAAGYKPGGYLKGYKKPKKAPAIDCLKKITDGEAVEGVSVAPQTIAACKKAKAGATSDPVKIAPPPSAKKGAIPPNKK